MLFLNMEKNYNVLLYYCYTKIKDPISFKKSHQQFCADLGLLGRIIVAKEGINGTISGLKEACSTYMKKLQSDPRFKTIDFKVDTHTSHAFQKLNVRVKKEIVHADLPDIDPTKKTGKYISPQELEKMKDDPDVILLDVRSNYEHQIGKFKNAVTLNLAHFREFKDQIPQLEAYKDKKVITYCTGGIKCEKASSYLLEKGFKNVYQLHGGIIKYGNETNGSEFEGQCYVFDNRLLKKINQEATKPIGNCYVCHIACDRMINCANPSCNVHVPVCTACADQLDGACSVTCQQHPAKRAYNGTGYYVKKLNGYNPYHNI